MEDLPTGSRFALQLAFAAAMMSGLCALVGLREHSDLAAVRGRTAVPATIISATPVLSGRSEFTAVVVDYRPDAGPGQCEVMLQMPPNDRGLIPGRVIPVIPRPVGCYQPVIPGSIGSPAWAFAGCVASFAVSLLGFWSFGRRLKKMAAAGHSFH